jgi:anti-sigma regulatory factor (Ser/Thr protein kinase)
MSLKVRADLEQLSQIREYAIEAATALGVVPSAFDDLRLAVDEAVTNIITHGYDGPGDIELDLTTEGSNLIVRVRDQAPPFDLASAPPIDLSLPGERDNPGGFGVFLMQSVMDEIFHQATKTGNELTMIKLNVVGVSS